METTCPSYFCSILRITVAPSGQLVHCTPVNSSINTTLSVSGGVNLGISTGNSLQQLDKIKVKNMMLNILFIFIKFLVIKILMLH